MRAALKVLSGLCAALFFAAVAQATTYQQISAWSWTYASFSTGNEDWPDRCIGLYGSSNEAVAEACVAKLPQSGTLADGSNYADPYVYNLSLYWSDYSTMTGGTGGSGQRFSSPSYRSVTCTDPQVPQADGTCTDPPDPNNCADRSGEFFYVNTSGHKDPFTATVDGCEASITPRAWLPDLSWGEGEASLTGNPASSSAPVLSAVADQAAADACTSGTAGDELCISRAGDGSGTYEGHPYTPTSPPEGDCTFFADGNYICNGTPTVPPVDPVTQETAPPTAEWSINNTSSTTTVVNNYNAGSGVSSNDKNGDEPGTCTDDPATSIDECGNLVKIDESGTPEATGTEFDNALDASGFSELIQSLESGQTNDQTGPGFGASDLGLPGYSATCDTLAFDWWGRPMEIPSVDACAQLTKIKSMLGWALYALTVLFLFQLAVTPIKS
jgi:hypothetical protein